MGQGWFWTWTVHEILEYGNSVSISSAELFLYYAYSWCNGMAYCYLIIIVALLFSTYNQFKCFGHTLHVYKQ